MIMKTKIKLSPANCYITMFAVSLFYFSYRYIMQWANEITSGTYSTTPAYVQFGKYIIVVFLLLVSAFFSLSRKLLKSLCLDSSFALIAFMFISSLYAFFIVKDQNTLMIMLGIAVVFMMILTIRNDIDFESLDKLVVFFLNANILYEGIQIFLYYTRGRLPAIAWENAGIMQVRFGGAFDDPFALSLFMGFIIPYVYHRFDRLKRWFYVGISVFMLVMTWTLTSVFAIIGIYALDRIYAFLKHKVVKPINFLIVIVVSIASLLFAVTRGADFLAELIRVKAGSILVHQETRSLDGLSIMAFLGLIPEAHYAEATPSRMIFTNGALFTVIFYVTGLISAKKLYRIIKKLPVSMEKYKPLFYGMFYYQLCFLLGSFNLPFPYMFFNMMVFSLFAGMAFVVRPENYYASVLRGCE